MALNKAIRTLYIILCIPSLDKWSDGIKDSDQGCSPLNRCSHNIWYVCTCSGIGG